MAIVGLPSLPGANTLCRETAVAGLQHTGPLSKNGTWRVSPI
jgi:hypothetical protein